MISTNRLLTSRNIFKLVDSYRLFKAYCPNFKDLDTSFNSDLRKDPRPSCRISYIRGDLIYTDFGYKSFRIIPYIMEKFSLSYHQALSKINKDFGLNLIDYNELPSTSLTKVDKNVILGTFEKKEKTPTIIDVSYRNFMSGDLAYWQQYGWTLDMLKMASIRPIDYYWLTKESKGIIKSPNSVSGELAYSFDFYRHAGVYRRKLYFPFRHKENRFISNVDSTIIQNWDILEKSGDTLFITSSKKDTGPFYRLYGGLVGNTKWNSIAPNSEVTFIPEEIFYTKLKRRFKRIILWYDNDTTGIENALKQAKKYQIEAYWNPIGSPKDPSDFVYKHGLREFNYILKNKINN